MRLRDHLSYGITQLSATRQRWFSRLYLGIHQYSFYRSRGRWKAESTWLPTKSNVVIALHCMHPFNDLSSRTTWVSRHQKGKPFQILMKQGMMGWLWHQLVVPRSRVQTLNHASTSPLNVVKYISPSSGFYVGTCEASRFEFESAARFDSKVMGWFENFRIESAVPAHHTSSCPVIERGHT